ncbi:hypothetical protein BASA81_002566 [Batrachochytrium salamandrivorans]|nr:hypothetical protein BASA81_002566 [Batrachochytrium salamandrivorans]
MRAYYRGASKVKRALNQVNMEVFFSPNLPWAVKGGAEGLFAGFTAAWLERVTGTFKLECGMEHVGNNTYCPRVTMRLCSNQEGDGGFLTTGRVENLSIFGSALPISLSVRDADLSVNFDMSMQVQYETEPGEVLGSWKVIADGFKLKVFQFHLKTRGALSALSIPDVVLGTMLQTIITIGFKRVVVMILPPELGMYMNAVHRYREMSPPAPNVRDVWHEPNQPANKERFIKLECKIDINQIIKLDMIDAPFVVDKLDLPSQSGALDVLQLDKDQMRLFLHTQRELGLTFANTFPSLAASNGDGSWFSSSSQEKTNRVPLESIEDCVRYLQDFLNPSNLSSGMKASRRLYSCERLTKLWNIALELVCTSLGGQSLHPEFSVGKVFKKMVGGRRASHAVTGPVKSFDFENLKKQVHKVAQKEIYVLIDIPVFSIAVALRGLIRVGRDIALRVLRMIGSKKKEVASAVVKKESTVEVGQGVASAISQDRDVEMKKLACSRIWARRFPVQIERGSDFLMDQLRVVQERYVDNAEARIGLMSREGNFRATAHEVRVRAPVDVGLQLASPLLAKVLSRTVKTEEEQRNSRQWLWNRKIEVENGQFKATISRAPTYRKEKALQGSMVDALRRMGGKAAAIADNKDSGEFAVSASGLFAVFRSEESAESEDVLSLHLRPIQDPDRVEIKALGTRAMRVHASIDLLEGQGQFATLFHYVDDFLESLGPKGSKMMSLARLGPKFVASFAARDSFFIEVDALVGLRGDTGAGDLVVFATNVQDRKVVHLGLTHNLQDLLRDLMDLLEGATNMSASNKPTTRKQLDFYARTFRIRAPYQVLCDANFVHAFLKNKLGTRLEELHGLVSTALDTNQDDELKEHFRTVPGVPLLYIQRQLLLMDAPSESSVRFEAQQAQKKLKVPKSERKRLEPVAPPPSSKRVKRM